jgi:hypothetical protein
VFVTNLPQCPNVRPLTSIQSRQRWSRALRVRLNIIRWRRAIHVCHVACLLGFSTATTAVSGKEQTLLLHFFTATNKAFQSTFGRALCMTFWLGLTCYLYSSSHRFTWCFWRKCYQNGWRKSSCHSGETCASSTAGLRLISHVRSENISSPLTAIPGLEGAGRWLGLPGHRTTHNWTFPMGLHLNLDVLIGSWFWRESYFPCLWGSNNHPAETWHFFSVHQNLYYVIVFFVSRPVAERLDICSKLVTNTTYAERFSACLNSEFIKTHFDGQWHCKDARPTCNCLTMNLCFGLSYHLKKFGHKVFPHVYKAFGVISYRRLSCYITPNLVQIVSANVLNFIGCDFNTPVSVVSELSLK